MNSLNKINELIGTFFFVGKFPYAPGTCASSLSCIIWFFIPNTLSLQIGIIIITFILGLYSCKYILIQYNNIKDPHFFVLDEVVGMWISLLILPKKLELYILAFFLFRFFDILKPSFIYYIDNYNNNTSIMFDDIVAGLLTLLICTQVNL